MNKGYQRMLGEEKQKKMMKLFNHFYWNLYLMRYLILTSVPLANDVWVTMMRQSLEIPVVVAWVQLHINFVRLLTLWSKESVVKSVGGYWCLVRLLFSWKKKKNSLRVFLRKALSRHLLQCSCSPVNSRPTNRAATKLQNVNICTTLNKAQGNVSKK